MSAPRNTSTAFYQYDPLDRLISAHSTQCFYNSTRIATEIQDGRKTCFFEQAAMPLAELQLGDAVTLLATDVQKTVLYNINQAYIYQQIYSPYGHRHRSENGLLNLLGFNGNRPDSVTGHYLLGQGHRAYNPVLMRFNSPDRLSPFREGGLNAYAYCEDDPINFADPSGKAKLFLFARKIFNQSNVSDALSRVKKSLGSVKKVKATQTPKKTTLSTSPHTQQTHVQATKRSQAEASDTHNKISTLAHKQIDANKVSSIAQSKTGIDPIFKDADTDLWNMQLRPRPEQPVVSRPVLPPIRKYAPPDGWDVLLPTDAKLQPVVRLIRMDA
jgi:RHS repeat-associated protein